MAIVVASSLSKTKTALRRRVKKRKREGTRWVLFSKRSRLCKVLF